MQTEEEHRRKESVSEGTHTKAPQRPLSVLRSLRDELRARLLQDVADFRVYVALENAILAIEEAEAAEPKANRTHGVRDWARKLLEESGPLSTSQIVDKLHGLGAHTTVSSVSSSLSQASDFVSVSFQGSRRWWLAGRPIPEDPASPPQIGARARNRAR
ncbi:hypothetical protein ABEG18_05870 [Alsobacter sp. KACC 23698]|uniref:Uncharacterized protein n=1 Tax=Alsobacter sp. KACC 23698 TaxID=3149229 RepID=A0AAU7JIQ8_9HYPH